MQVALQVFCNRWCKGEHVEYKPLNAWKLNIFNIIDSRISFYYNSVDLLPPKFEESGPGIPYDVFVSACT